MWGRVEAGNLGVPLQTLLRGGGERSSAGLVNRQTVCGFKAPRSRGTKTPDRKKQNKTNTQPKRGRESIGLKRV